MNENQLSRKYQFVDYDAEITLNNKFYKKKGTEMGFWVMQRKIFRNSENFHV